MASAMLVLVVPPWPAARGLLRNWLEQLQRKLQHNRLGLPLHPWALAVQGPAICTEPAKDTNGNEEISSLLDSIFWMAAPQNRCSIEVNRCRRRNPQKLIKVKARAPWRSCSHNAVACQDLSSDSNCICNLEHSSRQYQILNPPSKARDHTGILIDTSQDDPGIQINRTQCGPSARRALAELGVDFTGNPEKRARLALRVGFKGGQHGN
uniref:Uncharacterized protein n=1 Tax=Sus scrofa TaxID=9823 RepID=A0A8D1ZET3_PIG